MANYKQASKAGQEMIITYIKNRMKEQGITNEKLAEILEIGITTLWRYLNMKTPLPLGVYLEICGALKLHPYLIPSESDTVEMKRMFFN
ncbi:hypothetical protein AUW17_05425 [Tenacibaculum dicentrarchi]|nr:hypothetical protein AUW17_05425 [Tenacibaculum dicentrarchi]